MGRWLIPGVGAVVLAVAIVTGAVVWAQQGDAGTCDRAALVTSISSGMEQAERDGRLQFEPERDAGCTDDDIADALFEMSSDWHVMPGGTVMKGGSHH